MRIGSKGAGKGLLRAAGLVAGSACVVLGVAACSGDDRDDPTGYGAFVTDSEQLTEMITQLQVGAEGAKPLYCEQTSTPKAMTAWLRGPDDFLLVADDRLGMARDAEAVTLWDWDQEVGLEILNTEMEMMNLDLTGLSSEEVFGNLISSGGGELRCRGREDHAYPVLTQMTVYTMGDINSGEMPPEMAQSLFEGFSQF